MTEKEREREKRVLSRDRSRGGEKTDAKKKTAALACFLSQPLVEGAHRNERGRARQSRSALNPSDRPRARFYAPTTTRTVRGQRHAEAPASSAGPDVPAERHHRRIGDDAAVVAVGNRDRRRRGRQGRPRQGARRGEAEVRPHAAGERGSSALGKNVEKASRELFRLPVFFVCVVGRERSRLIFFLSFFRPRPPLSSFPPLD